MPNFNLDNYVPVHERLQQFWDLYATGRIVTDIVQHDTDLGLILMKASIYRSPDDAEPAATGHAFEVRGEGHVNKTSHIENCETSAVGRALANLGLDISKGIASREEMAKVERMQPVNGTAKPALRDKPAYGKSRSIPETASDAQLTLLRNKAKNAGLDADEYAREKFSDVEAAAVLSKAAASWLIDSIETAKAVAFSR